MIPLWGAPRGLARSLPPSPPQSSLRSSPCAHWGPNSAWSSRRSSWNSVGRAPSLKRRSQCGERESLLSGEGKGSTDEEAEDGRPRAGRAESLDHRSTLDLRPPRPAALVPAKLHNCNGQVLALPSEFFLRIDSHRDTAEFDDDVEDVSGALPTPRSTAAPTPSACHGPGPRSRTIVHGRGEALSRTHPGALRTLYLSPQSCCSRLHKVLEPYKPEWCQRREPWALYLFSPQNR